MNVLDSHWINYYKYYFSIHNDIGVNLHLSTNISYIQFMLDDTSFAKLRNNDYIMYEGKKKRRKKEQTNISFSTKESHFLIYISNYILREDKPKSC